MRRSAILIVVALVAAAVGFWAGHAVLDEGSTRSFAGQSTMDGKTCYPVYGLDAYSMEEQVLLCFPISDTLDVEGKLRVLADRLSRCIFGRLPIEVLSVDNRSGRRIARVNLQEVRDARGVGGWYLRFQGSTGGSQSQYGLVQTFLQREYRGKWIDGIEFYYNGEPFTQEWDHINLSGQIDRVSHKIPSYIQTILLSRPPFIH